MKQEIKRESTKFLCNNDEKNFILMIKAYEIQKVYDVK